MSKLEVVLMNEQEQIIERTWCSSSGLYMVPVFDPRRYYLKVVNSENSGIFKPDRITIDLEAKSDEEIHEIVETSFNFKFAGFYIQEKITSLGATNGGPKGVQLAIYNAKGKEIGRSVPNNKASSNSMIS